MKKSKTNLKKLYVFAFYMLIQANELCAQTQVISKLNSFRDDWVKPMYIPIVGIVLLAGSVMNLGLVWGENKEWKGFFTKLGIYMLAVTMVIGIFEGVNALSL